MVRIITVRQNVPCRARWLYVVHRLLSAARLSAGSTAVRCVAYTADLADIADQHGASLYVFADDTMYRVCQKFPANSDVL